MISGRWRLAPVVLGAVALGGVLALVKGRGDGLGHFVGNLSWPYLSVAFIAGRVVQRRRVACVVGVLVTWATLSGFSASAELVFGHPSGSMTRSYSEWFLAGTLSGAVLGALGRESRACPLLLYVLPLALALEPSAVVAVQAAGRFGGLDPQPLQLVAWSGEVVLGAIAVILTRWRLATCRM